MAIFERVILFCQDRKFRYFRLCFVENFQRFQIQIKKISRFARYPKIQLKYSSNLPNSGGEKAASYYFKITRPRSEYHFELLIATEMLFWGSAKISFKILSVIFERQKVVDFYEKILDQKIGSRENVQFSAIFWEKQKESSSSTIMAICGQIISNLVKRFSSMFSILRFRQNLRAATIRLCFIFGDFEFKGVQFSANSREWSFKKVNLFIL